MLVTTYCYKKDTLRVVFNENGIFWVASDVLKVLTTEDFHTVLREKVFKGDLKNVLINSRLKTCISTAGLFGLIYQLDKPSNYVFKEWVENVVLPKYLANQYFLASSLNPGLAKVIQNSLSNLSKTGFVSIEDYLDQRRISLSKTDLKTLEKRAAQFFRVGKQQEPPRQGSITVYPRQDESFLEAALDTVLTKKESVLV